MVLHKAGVEALERVNDERAHVFARMRVMLAEDDERVRRGERQGRRWLVSADIDILLRTTFTRAPALGVVYVLGMQVGVDSNLPNRSIMLEAAPMP